MDQDYNTHRFSIVVLYHFLSSPNKKANIYLHALKILIKVSIMICFAEKSKRGQKSYCVHRLVMAFDTYLSGYPPK